MAISEEVSNAPRLTAERNRGLSGGEKAETAAWLWLCSYGWLAESIGESCHQKEMAHGALAGGAWHAAWRRLAANQRPSGCGA